MDEYAVGQGHYDLACCLSIPTSASLALSGSSNSRIIRTTLKHSYRNTHVFYVVGLTFLSREEVPILEPKDAKMDWLMEGRWTNPQNQDYAHCWQPEWTSKDTARWVELKLKSDMYSIADRLENLQYQLLAMIHSLQCRGHRVLIYQQADDIYQSLLDQTRFRLLRIPEIIDGLKWQSILWQHQQGVLAKQHPDYLTNPYGVTPEHMRHRRAGAHEKLNEFLTTYIKDHKILR